MSQRAQTVDEWTFRFRKEGGAKASPQTEAGKAPSPSKPAAGQSGEKLVGTTILTADELTRRATSASDSSSSEKQGRSSSATSSSGEGRPAQSKKGGGRSGQQSGGSNQQNSGQGQQNSGGSSRQNRGNANGKNGSARLPSANSASGGSLNDARSSSPSDLFAGRGAGSDGGKNGWTSALSNLGTSTASGKGGGAGSASGPPRTLPTAWLKSATHGPLNTAELASGWKSMELTLGQENGTVTVQARSDQDSMAVSVSVSESRLRAQLASNARQIQDVMQAQYGSDVDLSFAGGDADESGGHMPDGSAHDERPSRSSSADPTAEDEMNDETTHRRGPHGGREWIG